MDKQVLHNFLGEMLKILNKEVLTYKYYENLYLIFIGFGFLFVATVFYFVVERYHAKQSKIHCHNDARILHIGTVVLTLISLAFILSNIPNLIQIKIAPKMYLLEYYSSLISHK